MTTTLNLELDEYTNRLLGVIKEMFGLRNKSEALNKLADMFGEEFIAKSVREDVAREVVESCNAHIRKHGIRKTSVKELDDLCGASE